MRRAIRLGVLAAAALGAACTDTGSDLGGSSAATVIAVSPPEFLGKVTCSRAPGSMQTFVATVTDQTAGSFVLPSSTVTPCTVAAQFRYVVPGHRYTAEVDAYDIGLDPWKLQSPKCTEAQANLASLVEELANVEQELEDFAKAHENEKPPPDPPQDLVDQRDKLSAKKPLLECLAGGLCRTAAGSLQVRGCGAAADAVAEFQCDHAEELGQKKIPPEILLQKQHLDGVAATFCGPSSGIRELETTDGQPVDPTWRTECRGVDPGAQAGQQLLGAESIEHELVVVEDCDPLEIASGAVIGISVDPSASLGALSCTGDGGSVASFDVVPDAAGLDPQQGVPCGTLPAPYTEGIAAGQAYTFRLDAYAKGAATATWRATCSAVAKDGLVVSASCNALTDEGGLVISLADDDIACPTGGTFRVALFVSIDGEAQSFTVPPFACGAPAEIAGLPPSDPSDPYVAQVEVLDPDGMPPACASCSAAVVPGETTTATCASQPCPP